MTATILVMLLVLFAILGAPLFTILLAVAMVGFYSQGIDLSVVAIEIYRIADMPLLLALPFFAFAGYVVGHSRTSERLVRLTQVFLGWMPGGLAIVSLVACALFTAFTGASGVTIVALGALLYPALMQDGYRERFSLGLVTLVVSLIGVVAAPVFVSVFAFGWVLDGETAKLALAADMLRLTFPYLFFISLTAFAGGILNAHDRFAVPAFTPVLLNLVLIGSVFFLAPHFDQPVYGLAAGVVTRDLARAHRIIHQMEAGICWINTWGESAAQMPVGGYKQSGVGRENGLMTLTHYTRTKSIQVELGDFASVF